MCSSGFLKILRPRTLWAVLLLAPFTSLHAADSIFTTVPGGVVDGPITSRSDDSLKDAVVAAERVTDTGSYSAPTETVDTDESADTTTSGSEPILEAGSTIFLSFTAPEPSREQLQEIPLPAEKLHVLDQYGVLHLPYLGEYPLAGLTASSAVLVLQADPNLEPYSIELVVLPVQPGGREALTSFGSTLFTDTGGLADPVLNVPIPDTYIIGPGDTFEVTTYGQESSTVELPVDREGRVVIPDLGPLPVAGLTFPDARKAITERISSGKIGVEVFVNMAALQSVTVFVSGQVNQPGPYNVTPITPLLSLLYLAEGVTDNGSMRSIQIRRNGALVTTLDLYDLLLKGTLSGNTAFRNGDVVFVPDSGRRVAAWGEVRRPAIYELRPGEQLPAFVGLIGGLLPAAVPARSQLQRFRDAGDMELLDLDLSAGKLPSLTLQDGDSLYVPSNTEELEEIITVRGYVRRPGKTQWREGLRIADLLPGKSHLKRKPDLDYVLVKRHQRPSRAIELLSVDLSAAWAEPEGGDNIALLPSDEIMVFGYEVKGDRQLKLKPIVEELIGQATDLQSAQIVKVGGSVFEPGTYPLEPGMTIADLITAAGGLTEEAYKQNAELTRYNIASNGERSVDHLQVQLAAGDAASGVALQSHDYLTIKKVPNWVDQPTVEISGEVRFPGSYPISRGEQLSNLVERAGGLTDLSFPQGTIFTRETLRVKEEERLQAMADRLETEYRTTLIQRIDDIVRPEEAGLIVADLIAQLRDAEPVGRLVIDLPAILDANTGEKKSPYDVTLQDGDKVIVPLHKEDVTVIGEVFNPTSHHYLPDLDKNDYVKLSGGRTSKAARSRDYVIRANGASAGTRSGAISTPWWKSSQIAQIQPGDTIIVPLDTDRLRPLDTWLDISSILFNLGRAAAEFDSVQGADY